MEVFDEDEGRVLTVCGTCGEDCDNDLCDVCGETVCENCFNELPKCVECGSVLDFGEINLCYNCESQKQDCSRCGDLLTYYRAEDCFGHVYCDECEEDRKVDS